MIYKDKKQRKAIYCINSKLTFLRFILAHSLIMISGWHWSKSGKLKLKKHFKIHYLKCLILSALLVLFETRSNPYWAMDAILNGSSWRLNHGLDAKCPLRFLISKAFSEITNNNKGKTLRKISQHPKKNLSTTCFLKKFLAIPFSDSGFLLKIISAPVFLQKWK